MKSKLLFLVAIMVCCVSTAFASHHICPAGAKAMVINFVNDSPYAFVLDKNLDGAYNIGTYAVHSSVEPGYKGEVAVGCIRHASWSDAAYKISVHATFDGKTYDFHPGMQAKETGVKEGVIQYKIIPLFSGEIGHHGIYWVNLREITVEGDTATFVIKKFPH